MTTGTKSINMNSKELIEISIGSTAIIDKDGK